MTFSLVYQGRHWSFLDAFLNDSLNDSMSKMEDESVDEEAQSVHAFDL